MDYKNFLGLNSSEYTNYIKKKFNAELVDFKINGVTLPLAVYVSEGKKIAGTFPKSYVTPYYDSDDSINFTKIMTLVLAKYPVDEVRFRILGLRKQDLYAPWLIEDVVSTSILEIEDGKPVEEFFKSETRTAVRKSLKQGFSIVFADSLSDFYKLYVDNMQRFGTKPRNLDHFNMMKKYIGKKLHFMLCYLDKELAGSNAFYINGNYLLMFHNLSYQKFWPMRVNNYLFYQMVDFGYTHGVKFFDFGPGMKSDTTHSRFKENYGAKEYKIYTGRLYRNPIFSYRELLINNLKLWRQNL